MQIITHSDIVEQNSAVQKCACAGHSGMLNHLWSSVYALTVQLVLLSLCSNLSCKITKNPTILPVDFKTRDLTLTDVMYAFISKADLHMTSLSWSEKDGENIGLISL